MTRIKLTILYYESKIVFALSKLFSNISYKFMDKHHDIYLKYFKLMKVLHPDIQIMEESKSTDEEIIKRSERNRNIIALKKEE